VEVGNEKKKVVDCSFEELKQVKLDSENKRIPTLEEVLNLCKGKANINIEFKGHQ
jgi:glycerophosphoryl diester phosphodiesterase